MLGSLRNVCLGVGLLLLTHFNLAHAVPLGAVMTDFGNYDLATAAAIQADGKIVVVGDSGGSYGYNAALARYLPDGRLDTSFGTGGKTTLDLAGCSCNEEVHAVAIQTDGKIVIAGSAVPGSTGVGTHFVLARFNANGTVDTGFGTSGKVFINLGGYYEYAYALAIQGDGKIVAAGDSDGDFALTRVSRSGRVDGTFGSSGKVRTDFAGNTDEAHGLVIQSDGKIVAGGIASWSTFGLARYLADGTLDSSFGSNGKVFGGIGGLASSLALQSDGKLILAGKFGPVLARFLSNGQLDLGFGIGGKVEVAGVSATAAVIQTDGKIVVGGYTGAAGFSVLRFDNAGATDASFGVAGIASVDINPPEYFSGLYNLAIQRDSKIVAVGIVQHNSLTHADFGVARFNADGRLDSNFGARADLAVTLTDGPDPIQAGSTLTYTIAVSNAGPDAAQKVEIGGIPANTTLVSATSTLGACTGAMCQIGILSANASATVTLVVKPYLNGTLAHSATVSTTTADSNSANNSASTSTVVNGAADLALSMTGPVSVQPGNNLTYTITVNNFGSGAASSVMLNDPLPYYVNFVSATASQGSCAVTVPPYGTPVLDCQLGSINAHKQVTVSLVVATTYSTTLINTATVSGIGDPNLANNSASVQTTVAIVADLSTTISASPNPVRVGNNLSYAITVNNGGPDASVNTQLRVSFPGSAWFVSVTPSQGTCNNFFQGYVQCDLGTINNRGNATVALVIVPQSTDTVVTSTFASSYDIQDPNSANDASSVSTTVTGNADLALTLSASPEPVRVGQSLTYTFVVTNNGPDAAHGVNISPQFSSSPSLTVVSWSNAGCSSAAYAYSIYYCEQLNSGATFTVTMVVSPQGTGNLDVSASVSSHVTDLNASNNSATVTSTITGAADLSIIMIGSPDPVAVNKSLTYSITVANSGPDAAIAATLTDTLPSGMTFVSATPSQGYCYAYYGPLNCDFGSINSGSNVTINLVVTPTVRAASLSNTASVASTVADPNTVNNSATAVTKMR